MSTIKVEQNELITCDLCQRRFNLNVYKRHRNENQCIKRNHHRLPFESIKQRSIQIGDKIFSVQQQKKTNDDVHISNNREKIKQQISNNQNKQCQEKILPSNKHRRTLEQAKLLLERRTKYKPPWIQKRSSFISNHQSKLNRTNTTVPQAKDSSSNTVRQELSPKKFYSRERPSPPTTKFKNDDLPIKVSDHHKHNSTIFQQPVLTHSPKRQTASKYQSNRVDQTHSASRPVRKAYTWTRSPKQPPNRDIISPIQIPTFCESSSGPSHDRLSIPFNLNYDDDEFERYSPTPPSTPKYQQDKIDIKNILPTVIRPNTYQKSKRSDREQQNETFIYPSSNQTHRKTTQSIFHLPPIYPSSYSKTKHRSIINPTPWR